MARNSYPYLCCKSRPVKFYSRSVRRHNARPTIVEVSFHAFCQECLPRGGHSLEGAANWTEVSRETWLTRGVVEDKPSSSV